MGGIAGWLPKGDGGGEGFGLARAAVSWIGRRATSSARVCSLAVLLIEEAWFGVLMNEGSRAYERRGRLSRSFSARLGKISHEINSRGVYYGTRVV